MTHSRIGAFLLSMIFLLFSGCNQSEQNLIPTSKTSNNIAKNRVLSDAFKDYWFEGLAEITSYTLHQERYGELRNGTAVNVFVTEDFLPEAQVKSNSSSETTVPVLKFNQTKKYITGIYPYSVMTSTFNSLNTSGHALKVSHSMQEWCGHVYMQLNNRESYDVISHSYFEGEADQSFTLEKNWLESELWNLIRLQPEGLPIGEIRIIPSFEFSRMSHKATRAHGAIANLQQGDSISVYKITYPNLNRELSIFFNNSSPYEIERWEEIHANGLKTTAQKQRRVRSAYWTQHGTQFEYLRDSLLLN